MRKATRYVTSALLLGAGVLLALYGLFASTFNERGGATYVTIAGRRTDAHLVGGISLAVGFVLVVAGIAAFRRSRS